MTQHKWGDGLCPCGQDTYLCQSCGRELCASVYPPTWRPDITGHKEAGNVCPTCLDPKSRLILAFSNEWRNDTIPTADIPNNLCGCGEIGNHVHHEKFCCGGMMCCPVANI